MKKYEYILAALGGIVTTYFKAYIPLFVIVLTAMVFDFLSGVAAAIITKNGLSSGVARKGALKKAVLLLSLMFGVFLDYMLPYTFSKMGITLNVSLLFSNVLGFYIAFCECISICENIYSCCPDSFPRWIVDILTKGKERLEGDNNDITRK